MTKKDSTTASLSWSNTNNSEPDERELSKNLIKYHNQQKLIIRSNK